MRGKHESSRGAGHGANHKSKDRVPGNRRNAAWATGDFRTLARHLLLAVTARRGAQAGEGCGKTRERRRVAAAAREGLRFKERADYDGSVHRLPMPVVPGFLRAD